jgi:hypothetical protein
MSQWADNAMQKSLVDAKMQEKSKQSTVVLMSARVSMCCAESVKDGGHHK